MPPQSKGPLPPQGASIAFRGLPPAFAKGFGKASPPSPNLLRKATQDRGYGGQARYCKPLAWLHPPSPILLRQGYAGQGLRRGKRPGHFTRIAAKVIVRHYRKIRFLNSLSSITGQSTSKPIFIWPVSTVVQSETSGTSHSEGERRSPA